jgi:SAM-dependent methyltransferase
MDRRDHPAPDRSSHPARRLTAPRQFEWTRQAGTGPGLAILGELAGATVVELGCGSGHNLAHLVVHHAALGVGVDHDPAKIARASASYGNLPGIRFVLAEAGHYLKAAAPGSADLVLSIFGAFSFIDPIRLLTVTARIMRPGGMLALTLRADDTRDAVVVLRRR